MEDFNRDEEVEVRAARVCVTSKNEEAIRRKLSN